MKENDKINWNNFYSDLIKGNYPKYPNETILKLFFGNYLKNKPKINDKMKLLDVGCGFGQNFSPFLEKNMECYGVEVSQDICNKTNQIYKSKGYNVNVKKGHNRKIPFDDNFFDYVISFNAIHYESSEANMKKAIKEHSRVLKKGGRLFIITVGPKHTIYKRAKSLGNHIYEISDFDFRNGSKYFYFDNLKYLKYYLNPFFNDIELGRITENYMEVPLDFLIAVATK